MFQDREKQCLFIVFILNFYSRIINMTSFCKINIQTKENSTDVPFKVRILKLEFTFAKKLLVIDF